MRPAPPSRATRAYRALLRLLPADFRADFGHEMEGVFLDEQRDARRSGRGASWRLWGRTLAGILATAPSQHADVLKQDLTYAVRALARTPAFAATAVLALALGIGGACAVFTLVDQVVLRRLPVSRPERLVYFDSPSFSYPLLREVQRQVPSLHGVFGWSIDTRHVTFGAGPEPVDVMDATGSIHDTLGIVPAAGRLLRPSDDDAREAIGVLSYSAWQQRFGGDPAIVGRTILVERTPITIVGVTPKGFFGVAPGLAPEVTVPAALAPRLRPEDAGILEEVGQSWLHIMGRIKGTLSLSEADAALQVAWPRVLEASTPTTVPATDRTRYLGRQTRLMEADTGFSRVRRRFQQPLWLLTALVALLLVVGCGTIANMMLSRTLARGHELSLRRAIGAGRGRLIRQLLTEALVLTTSAACLGILAGMWGSQALVRLLSTTSSLITVDTTPTLPTVGAAAGLSLAIAAFVTACSAFCALRTEAGDALRAAPRAVAGSNAERRLGTLLVSVQVALSMTLVVGASVFALNLHRLLTEPLGLDPAGVLMAHADPLFAGHTDDTLPAYYERAVSRLAALPGIISASYSRKPPVSSSDGSWWEAMSAEGRPAAPRTERTYLNAVSPDYFSTIGMRVLAGRVFNGSDRAGSAPVVIVNAKLAARLFRTLSPLGRRIWFEDDGRRHEFTIVGVVGDVTYQYVHEDPRDIAYFPYLQAAERLRNRNLTLELKTAGPPSAVIALVRDALREEDARVPVVLETLDERIAESLVQERALALLATSLGVTALVLAAAALYGLMAYAATARTREFGVRIALGATPAGVARIVIRDAVRITAIGVTLGLGLTLAVGEFAEPLLVAITPGDPTALGAAIAIVSLVAVSAALVPAWRSSRVQPTDALKVN